MDRPRPQHHHDDDHDDLDAEVGARRSVRRDGPLVRTGRGRRRSRRPRYRRLAAG